MKVKIKKSALMNEDTSQEDLIKCANDFVTAVTNLGNAQFTFENDSRCDSVISIGCLLFIKVCSFAVKHSKVWLLKAHFTTKE